MAIILQQDDDRAIFKQDNEVNKTVSHYWLNANYLLKRLVYKHNFYIHFYTWNILLVTVLNQDVGSN